MRYSSLTLEPTHHARVIKSKQFNLTEEFAKDEDVHKIMAPAIYSKASPEIAKEEHFVGKTAILSFGYGKGAKKFQA